jgi:hypothetical protein
MLISGLNHGATKGGPWDVEQHASHFVSHGARGVNGWMVDGSARWVGRDEVKRDGRLSALKHPDWMTNVGNIAFGSNLQKWARQHGTISP